MKFVMAVQLMQHRTRGFFLFKKTGAAVRKTATEILLHIYRGKQRHALLWQDKQRNQSTYKYKFYSTIHVFQ